MLQLVPLQLTRKLWIAFTLASKRLTEVAVPTAMVRGLYPDGTTLLQGIDTVQELQLSVLRRRHHEGLGRTPLGSPSAPCALLNRGMRCSGRIANCRQIGQSLIDLLAHREGTISASRSS